MSVNPINLSIMIGDGEENSSPHVTPRNINFRPTSPTKSCLKTRIASLTSPVSMKPNNKFRQWADPPPPPTRSRTAERKSTTGIKRRTGSVDSRFRRTLTENSDKKKTFEEIKTEFLFSSRTLKSTFPARLNENETLNQETETTDVSCTVNITENQNSIVTEIDKLQKNDYKSIYHTLEPPIGKYKVNNELEKQSAFEISEDSSVSEIFNTHKAAGYNQLKPKPCVNVETILSNEPQTEILFGRIADNFSQTDISIASRIKYDDKSSDLFGLKEDESFISDVYSKDSQETIETEANFMCKNCANKEKSKDNRYLRYLEIWSTILTLSTVGALTWVYVMPYIQEYALYVYHTHINPKPEPSSSIFDYFYQFYKFIEDVLSTPTHTRIKYFK